jgi:hypothetical protein
VTAFDTWPTLSCSRRPAVETHAVLFTGTYSMKDVCVVEQPGLTALGSNDGGAKMIARRATRRRVWAICRPFEGYSICGTLMSTVRDESMIGTFWNSVGKSAPRRLQGLGRRARKALSPVSIPNAVQRVGTLLSSSGGRLERTDERD